MWRLFLQPKPTQNRNICSDFTPHPVLHCSHEHLPNPALFSALSTGYAAFRTCLFTSHRPPATDHSHSDTLPPSRHVVVIYGGRRHPPLFPPQPPPFGACLPASRQIKCRPCRRLAASARVPASHFGGSFARCVILDSPSPAFWGEGEGAGGEVLGAALATPLCICALCPLCLCVESSLLCAFASLPLCVESLLCG
jgi:hypothetical protein